MSQPKSLKFLAGAATAKHLGSKRNIEKNNSGPKCKRRLLKPRNLQKAFDRESLMKNIPPQIQQLIIPFYKGAALADFIDLHEGILNLKNKYCSNDDIFQHFLLDFFLELENDDLHPTSLARLSKQYLKFKTELQIKKVWFINKKNKKMFVNVTEFDWVTRALGFEKNVLPQILPTRSEQKVFFLIKFNVKACIYRYPIPEVPFLLKEFVPVIPDYSFVDGFFLPLTHTETFQREEYSEPHPEPDALSEKFFMRLAALAKCLQRDAIHEALAFVAELLGRGDFSASPFLKKFFIHVWGNFAVCLAKLHIGYSIIYSCLAECEKCMVFESDRLDLLYYRQQVYALLGNYSMEKICFETILERVPRRSRFFKQSFSTHVQCFFHFIEDLILELHVMEKIGEDAKTLDDRKELIFSIIQKLRRLVHSFFAKEGYGQNDFPKIFNIFDVISVYEIVVQIMLGIHSAQDDSVTTKLECIYQRLKNSDLSIEIFLESFVIVSADLMTLLDDCHDIVKTEAHSNTPPVWGNCMFTMAIMEKFINENESGSTHYATEARLIYEKTDSYRTNLLLDFMYCTTKSEKKFKVPEFSSIKVIPQFDIVKAFQLEPLIPQLVFFGIESLKRFDKGAPL
jgi:hypothetical protein